MLQFCVVAVIVLQFCVVGVIAHAAAHELGGVEGEEVSVVA